MLSLCGVDFKTDDDDTLHGTHGLVGLDPASNLLELDCQSKSTALWSVSCLTGGFREGQGSSSQLVVDAKMATKRVTRLSKSVL